MGFIAPVIPALLGAAAVGLGAYSMSKMMKGIQGQNPSAGELQSLNNQNMQAALDTLPKAPEAPTGDALDAANNEAEAARKEQLQMAARNEAAVNPTGGLGLSSATANTKKKTLGGI